MESLAVEVKLTNLDKLFWPELGITKGDLIHYYEQVAPVLLPHMRDRAMVMKRYPNGAHAPFFFQKRVPNPAARLRSGLPDRARLRQLIDFPVINDLPSLQWLINLGCIDLNPWYATCDDRRMLAAWSSIRVMRLISF